MHRSTYIFVIFVKAYRFFAYQKFFLDTTYELSMYHRLGTAVSDKPFEIVYLHNVNEMYRDNFF